MKNEGEGGGQSNFGNVVDTKRGKGLVVFYIYIWNEEHIARMSNSRRGDRNGLRRRIGLSGVQTRVYQLEVMDLLKKASRGYQSNQNYGIASIWLWPNKTRKVKSVVSAKQNKNDH